MRTLVLACGAAVALGAGCATYCSDISAVSGFALYVTPHPRLADGVYRWTVTADGVTRTRDVTIFHGEGRCACGTAGDPPGSASAAELWIDMSADRAELTLLDDPTSPTNTRQAGPPHVDVAIARDGATLATFSFDPVYRPITGDCQTVERAEYSVAIAGP